MDKQNDGVFKDAENALDKAVEGLESAVFVDVRERVYKMEEEFLSPSAFKSKDTRGRKYPINPCTLRTDFQRDRDRIIHCKAFRRLKHKTQVFLSPEGDHYRTRLTHTLEVSQIARTIGRALQLNEDLIEAIAMGHDLGHTPFGHAGEKTLQKLTGSKFSHNEQSIRVVEVLENNGAGLNLTYEVLDGILNHRINGNPSTLEGKVVSYADRIAYINHDIDDGIRAGLITESGLPDRCTDILGHSHGERINTLVYDIVRSSLQTGKIGLSAEVDGALTTLRQHMFDTLYTMPAAKSEEVKADRLIAIMYEWFFAHTDELPEFYRGLLEKYSAETVVCDYIASMSDRYAVSVFENLFVPESWKKY